MHLRERVTGPHRDEITEVVTDGEPMVPLLLNYYPDGLREEVLGPHRKERIRVSRYYPTLKLVVDFEPRPPDPFYEQEKRRYFLQRGIAYVTIGLREVMDAEGFRERVQAAKTLAAAGSAAAWEQAALQTVKAPEDWLQDPELVTLIDRFCLQELEAEAARTGKRWKGTAKQHVLRRIKQREIDTLRKGLKYGSIVDPRDRYRQSADAAVGRTDGQVPPSDGGRPAA